ncbi:MAG: hypothetical protein ACFFCQ_04410 [Promethearchaeota archaeon]
MGEQTEIAILAAKWDEVMGPQVLSEHPVSPFDTETTSVAVQIYMTSVTIFGQTGKTKQIDFSVPLLSLGSESVVRVAFDAWEDPNVRGEERPFFLAIVAEKETQEKISEYLDKHIWEYMTELKKNMTISASRIYSDIIQNVFEKATMVSTSDIAQTIDIPLNYTTDKAIEDLERSARDWSYLRDKETLRPALKAALFLEDKDFTYAGDAFLLAGNIYFADSEFQLAQETFLKSVECYKKVLAYNKAGDAKYNAGIAAFRNNDYKTAYKLLEESQEWITDPLKNARLYYYLGQVATNLNKFEDATRYFEKALDGATSRDSRLASQITSAYAGELYNHSEQLSPSEISQKIPLVEKAAKMREKAADFFEESAAKQQAAASLLLATRYYTVIENSNAAATVLERLIDLQFELGNQEAAARALIESARLPQTSAEAAISLLFRAKEILEKVEDEDIRKSLLGSINREKGRKEESRGNLVAAQKAYLETIKLYDPTPSQPSPDYLASLTSYANLLFRLENYEKAGEVFLDAKDAFYKTAEHKEQGNQCLRNAYVAFVKAMNNYHAAGAVLLHQGEEESAARFLELCIRAGLKSVEISTPDRAQDAKNTWQQQKELLLTLITSFTNHKKLESLQSKLRNS